MKSESFGELIRRLRITNKLSLRLVSAEIDLDQSTLSKIERNEKQAPDYIVAPLSKLFKQDLKFMKIKHSSEKLFYALNEDEFSIEILENTIKRLKYEGSGTRVNEQRELLLKKLRKYLESTVVNKAWIFGSFARNEEKFDSDIDLLVQFDENHNLDLFEYIGITHQLEDLLGRNVDIVQEGKLLPNVAKEVKSEKQLVYER